MYSDKTVEGQQYLHLDKNQQFQHKLLFHNPLCQYQH